jgi:hypothetical protein
MIHFSIKFNMISFNREKRVEKNSKNSLKRSKNQFDDSKLGHFTTKTTQI